MAVKLKKVNLRDKTILCNLLQLYLHDISYYFPIEFDDNKGSYLYDDIEKYFNNLNNHAYFVNNCNRISGFMLIDKIEETMIIQEMFVLNNYKNKGIGKNAVFTALDKYKGNWVIKSLPGSIPAEQFWLRTIKEYTNGNFNVEHVGKYNRAVFTFNSRNF